MRDVAHKLGRILLVEDNPADRALALEAFRDSLPNVEVFTVNDGQQAIEFLRRTGEFQTSPQPDLVLLDLNLPRKNGRQVLAELKMDPLLRQIPVVIFSGSLSQDDVQACYSLHANCYISKPIDLDTYFEVLQDIERVWLADACRPDLDAYAS